MPDIVQTIEERFVKIVNDVVLAAMLGEYGFPGMGRDDYNPDKLRANLQENLTNLPGQESAFQPFTVLTWSQKSLVQAVNDGVAAYQTWLNKNKPKF